MKGLLTQKEVKVNVYILGLTGAGKTHLLYNSLLEDNWKTDYKTSDTSGLNKLRGEKHGYDSKWIALEKTLGHNAEQIIGD